MPDTRISLHPRMFGETESVLASYSGLSASTFRYRSGVLGLRLANEQGHLSLLPFQGQQIWDAEFRGRKLAMKSIFAEPQADPGLPQHLRRAADSLRRDRHGQSRAV